MIKGGKEKKHFSNKFNHENKIKMDWNFGEKKNQDKNGGASPDHFSGEIMWCAALLKVVLDDVILVCFLSIWGDWQSHKAAAWSKCLFGKRLELFCCSWLATSVCSQLFIQKWKRGFTLPSEVTHPLLLISPHRCWHNTWCSKQRSHNVSEIIWDFSFSPDGRFKLLSGNHLQWPFFPHWCSVLAEECRLKQNLNQDT